MRTSIRLRALMITLGLLAIMTLTFLPGCTTEKVVIPQNIDELSLVKIWDTVAKVAKVNINATELESFSLSLDKDGRVDSLTCEFHDGIKGYQVNIDSNGNINSHLYKSLLPPTRPPIEVFSEIDKIKLSSLKMGEAGLWLQVDFQFSPGGWSNDNLNIYHLDNGTLVPLKDIVFSVTPYCVVSVYQRTSNGLGTTATTAAGGERTTTQTWFLSIDMNKAKIIEPL